MEDKGFSALPAPSRKLNFSLNQLQHAITAADYGSLRQAADVLSIKQSTLSRSIQLLEHGSVLPYLNDRALAYELYRPVDNSCGWRAQYSSNSMCSPLLRGLVAEAKLGGLRLASAHPSRRAI